MLGMCWAPVRTVRTRAHPPADRPTTHPTRVSRHAYCHCLCAVDDIIGTMGANLFRYKGVLSVAGMAQPI